ncbi:Ribosomal protein S18 acetylase RimI [Pseudomonas delhiensis]|uniref:Ribosomal protein S18 acetylase RimI n=1 Tax=Pseudomonas delhiensis TaxID=366289 RepID=A0A239K3W5_9PSED|nr:GNAT family N-acetyltransferase [Pseudomonas delhiensis]SDI99448.1 Ribosomal protein S18 acetylase RimI [Pseudomonas delhiensis]SNT11854.1 Ribosomal protein S18 acetylase RimI [Pseudomonas delhiensis]
MQVFRQATPDDAPAIARLVDEAYSPYIPRIGRKPAPMLDDYRQVVAEADVFVCARDGEVAGVLVLRLQGPVVLLENIAVAPAFKGRGIGKALLAFCEDYARARRLEAIELYTNQLMTENIALYTKLGYRETHRATEDGFARVFMRKGVVGPA